MTTDGQHDVSPYSDATTDMAVAFRLVGEFLWYFSLLEAQLDRGIARLLNLSEGTAAIVAANTDFQRKLKILFSSEAHVAAKPDAARAKLMKQTWSRVSEINNARKVAAHSRFEFLERGGVVFTRVVADRTLSIKDDEWTFSDFDRLFSLIHSTTIDLERMVDELEPFESSFNFSDPRNSGLIAALGS